MSNVYINKEAAQHAVLHNEGQAAVAAIEAIQPEDVAPVVRCKDCGHSYEDVLGRVCSYGVCVDFYVPDTFSCINGERKENEK